MVSNIIVLGELLILYNVILLKKNLIYLCDSLCFNRYWGGELPYFIDSSLTAMPFFYMGMMLKKSNILGDWVYDKYLYQIFIICMLIVAFLAEDNSMRSNRYDNPYLYHITAMCGVIGILAICKKIGRIPLVAALYGRYSIIVLGTHPLLINPIRRFSILFVGGSSLFTFTMVALAEMAVVPLFVKLFPYFCAQKSIFDLFSKYIVIKNER